MELSLSVLLSIVYYIFFFLSRWLLYFRDYSIIGAECVSFFLFTPTKLCGISVTIHKNSIHIPTDFYQFSTYFSPSARISKGGFFRLNCYFFTFGCKVNSCETAGMEAIFQAAGYTITTQPEQADVIILNTCTVTASGDSRMHTALRRLRAENPDAVMVLTGCFAQAFPEEAAALPEADLVIGTQDRDRLPQLVQQFLMGNRAPMQHIPA